MNKPFQSWVPGMPKTTSAMRYTAPLLLLWNLGPNLGSLWTRTYLPQPGPSNLRGVLGVWFLSGRRECSMCPPHKRTVSSASQETQGLGMSTGGSASPCLLSTAPPQPTQNWNGAATWSAYEVGKAKCRRPKRVMQLLMAHSFSGPLWNLKLSAGGELPASTTSSQNQEGSRDTLG